MEINKLASVVSTLFSPLLVPTYAVGLSLATTILVLTPLRTRVGVVAAIFMITCVFPMLVIGVLWKAGYVTDPGLNKRTERTVPYLVTMASYIGAGFYLWRVHAPLWLVMFLVGAIFASLTSLVVNRWWKISAHMAAMGGLLGLTIGIGMSSLNVENMVWWIVAVAIMCGAVGSSRLILKRHTPMQVLAGFFNGLVWVLGLFLLAI